MIEIDQNIAQTLKATARLICEEALKRGWKVKAPYIGSVHLYIDRRDGKEPIHVYSSTPPTTSYAAAVQADNKLAVYHRLKSFDIPQFETLLYQGKNSEQRIQEIFDAKKKVVAKPIDGSHGNGITTNIDNIESLRVAVNLAKQHSKQGKVIIQEQFSGEFAEIRVLTINYKMVGAIERVPARVFGDGKSTIRQLIEQENSSARRGEQYRAPLTRIDIKRSETFLKQVIQTIPAAGEEVSVLGIANYGAGGELVDSTDRLPKHIIAQAEEIAKLLELPVAGVDYIVKAGVDFDKLKPEEVSVLEVNKCPSLCIHDEPTAGDSQPATEKFLDYLDTL